MNYNMMNTDFYSNEIKQRNPWKEPFFVGSGSTAGHKLCMGDIRHGYMQRVVSSMSGCSVMEYEL